MKKIQIADSTLCRNDRSFSFKEKIEIARQLDKLNVDRIELPEIKNEKIDILLIRTISSFVKNTIISVEAGSTIESIDKAFDALKNASNKAIRITLPVSSVLMEYNLHKKNAKMLEWIEKTVSYAKEKCDDIEFVMKDVTRAEEEFVKQAVEAAVKAGATSVCFCDSAGEMLPDEFALFIENISKDISIPVGVYCSNKNGLACANALLAVKKNASIVKTSVGGDTVETKIFASLLKNSGETFGISSDIVYTKLNRRIENIERIINANFNEKSFLSIAENDKISIRLDKNDSIEDVIVASKMLGYDLTDEDGIKVFEAFKSVAEKKNVGAKELDAIIANVSLQAPETYKLVSYIVNNGNLIATSAQITLEKNSETMQGICIGDGPVDAAFHAIEQITGCHYELDDFQIQSVTEGKEAIGSALVKLRFEGKLYSGNGISTDIVGASVKAYLNALNKIVFEEA